MQPDEAIRMLKHFEKLKVLPGSQLPEGLGFHVCCARPQPGSSNYEHVCAHCRCKVYAGDVLPDVEKICQQCFLKLADSKPGAEIFGNQDSIAKFILAQKRN